jgi:hypothetical protein
MSTRTDLVPSLVAMPVRLRARLSSFTNTPL